ncbi:Alpha/Beta hydrolase protein [Aspergillus pseudodeflectus]|uniref:Alpha/Beta hydrolase protein n=1 Tax=Aspergillus pseudodeflectus TaxID=176178 RepID=A0ABR4K182_9EURO
MASSGDSGFLIVSENPPIKIFFEATTRLPLPQNKPILVLSNSLSAATWLWDEFVDTFSRDYTIIRYDTRFHGQSPLSAAQDFDYGAGHTLDDLAADVIQLLDYLGINQAEAFVGLSIGGGIGVVLAATRPQRFRHFLVVGSRAHATPADDQVWDERVALARQKGVAELAKQSVARWFNDEWRAAHAKLAADITAKVGTQPLEGYLASVAALRKLNLWPHAGAIRDSGSGGKVLFVVGDQDAVSVVEETKALAAQTGSSMVVIKDAGHIVHIQQPGRFNQVVKEALEGSVE